MANRSCQVIITCANPSFPAIFHPLHPLRPLHPPSAAVKHPPSGNVGTALCSQHRFCACPACVFETLFAFANRFYHALLTASSEDAVSTAFVSYSGYYDNDRSVSLKMLKGRIPRELVSLGMHISMDTRRMRVLRHSFIAAFKLSNKMLGLLPVVWRRYYRRLFLVRLRRINVCSHLRLWHYRATATTAKDHYHLCFCRRRRSGFRLLCTVLLEVP